MRDQMVFDDLALLDPDVLENPYPVYHELRSKDPVHWSSIFGGAWLITRYDDVVAALRDHRRLSSKRCVASMIGFPTKLKEKYHAFERFYSNIMLVFDGRKHTRFRSLVSKAFTPGSLQALQSMVKRVVEDLLDQTGDAGRMDLVRDFAYPLPAIVIAEMMGLPWEDRDRLKLWADDLALFIGGSTDPEELVAAAQRSMGAMAEYFENCISMRRENPGEDLISKLLTVDHERKQLSLEEVWAQCLLLLTAGHQTTRDLVSGGMWALMQNPSQFQQLKQDPSLVDSAVEECLRYDSPVQMAGRVATETFKLGGKSIGKGQRVIMLLGAANRDPDRFPEPDRFLISRTENKHVAFGFGPHHCLGATLARLEAQAALRVMLGRLPDLRPLIGKPVRNLNATFRRITHLPVAWGKREGA